jgi:hypothetical protein
MHTMKKRVTMTLDSGIHARARQLAREQGTTFSDLVETLLAGQVRKQPSVVDAMIGSASLKPDAAGTDPKGDRLRAKYLREDS